MCAGVFFAGLTSGVEGVGPQQYSAQGCTIQKRSALCLRGEACQCGGANPKVHELCAQTAVIQGAGQA